MKHWAESLPYTPCADALAWLRTQPDAQTAWDKSERGDWMLYHAGRLVCLDYAMTIPNPSTKLKKVDWR